MKNKKPGPYRKILAVNNGIARVKKHCGFCDRTHIVNFPLDDMDVERRMSTFCDDCEVNVIDIKKRQSKEKGK